MPPATASDSPRPFYLGLNMTGAVSAGAYTAGVVDFLIEALDTWYAARAAQPADPAQWVVPAHELRLAVMSGASAGGMCAAISASALCQPFTHVRSIDQGQSGATNALYKAWVEDIDISKLLGKRDLPDSSSQLISVLDSTPIDDIANSAIGVSNPLAAPRPWLLDPLRLILTLTNLNGVPYQVDGEDGGEQTQTLYHADQRDFALSSAGAGGDRSALPLSPREANNWDRLRQTAKATGAFPLMLAPRYLDRLSGEFNQRRWRISAANPECVDGKCVCSTFDLMPPNWPQSHDDAVPFRTLNVDGGVTNNTPFDCAHQVLTELPGGDPGGHNPRDAMHADRAVINVAPFLSTPKFDIKTVLPSGLLPVLGSLVDTVINQSRIQGENIELSASEAVFSRFTIAPSDPGTPLNPLASATLSAFGGFLARGFRDHDYQLGRRNCQQFLRKSFILPLDNVWMRQFVPPSQAVRDRLLNDFGADLDNGAKGIQLIPLVGACAVEIPADRRSAAMDRDALPPLADQAVTRLKLVIDHLITKAGWLPEATLDTVWFFAKSHIKDALIRKVASALAADNLINPPE